MIRILIVDDHAIVRQGLKQIVAESAGMQVAGEAGSAGEAIERLSAGRWDVVVLDLTLPDRSGLDLLKEIKARHPGLAVLVLTMHGEDQYAERVLRAGAAGYLTKESAPEQLIAAIQKVAHGGRHISPGLAERLALQVVSGRHGLLHESLSDREFQVLCLLASGRTLTDIAQELGLSVKTISTHRARILQKMGMENNAQLIHYAIQQKLVQ